MSLEARNLALPGRLRETSLSLRPGALVCLVGPNGSGKTSLLHAIAGIGRPAGTVRIDGADLHAAAPARRARLAAFLPASRDVKWPLAARDLIALGGATPSEIAGAVAALGLGAVIDRRIDRLSTGERSRVLLARALAPGPRLLLLDEPTANLDPLWQIRLMEMLRGFARDGGMALVAIHDLEAAGRHADRLLVMQDGAIAADGQPTALLAGPAVRDAFGIERVDGLWRPVG